MNSHPGPGPDPGTEAGARATPGHRATSWPRSREHPAPDRPARAPSGPGADAAAERTPRSAARPGLAPSTASETARLAESPGSPWPRRTSTGDETSDPTVLTWSRSRFRSTAASEGRRRADRTHGQAVLVPGAVARTDMERTGGRRQGSGPVGWRAEPTRYTMAPRAR